MNVLYYAAWVWIRMLCVVPYFKSQQKMPKYASGACIFQVLLNIVYVGSVQNHYLDSKECCAHRATYSCLGNINHFILTTDFSYCENLCSEVSHTRSVWAV